MRRSLLTLSLVGWLSAASLCWAHGTVATQAAPRTIAVSGPLAAPPPGVTDLKFREMFQLPIGPKGLALSDKLRQLDGKPVRMVGYMVAQESASAGEFILSPLPVEIGDEDESLSDDLPASSIFVHLAPEAAVRTVPNLGGLLRVTGTLRIGVHDEPDGRVSSFRLELDEPTSQTFAPSAR
ncbi:MAG: hypothetical protein KGL90_14975 [Burkholderiales bacterium]|nr:hypothetical protein [Burkholderiales bacterium]